MELLIKRIKFILILSFFILAANCVAEEKNSFAKLRDLSSHYENVDEILPLLQSINSELNNNSLDFKFYTLDDPKVLQGIEDAAEISEPIKAELVNVLEKRLLALLDTDDSERLSSTYSEILKLRPDPSEANNTLRMTVAIRASSSTAKEFAQGRIEELKYLGSFDQGDKFRLMASGYLSTYQLFFIILFFLVALFAIVILIERIFFHGKFKNYFAQRFDVKLDELSFHQTLSYKSKPATASEADSPSNKKDKNSRGYMRTTVAEDEYSKLLSSFNLDDTATEDMIKKVYRQKLKELHPDKNLMTANEQELQDLKETYDRIMEIRSSWFGGRR
ncbi:MAG: J domain-containing protein [Proteobacteria bacterium]|nr:J domain-containing protein [Pseudomonadota bacterium]